MVKVTKPIPIAKTPVKPSFHLDIENFNFHDMRKLFPLSLEIRKTLFRMRGNMLNWNSEFETNRRILFDIFANEIRHWFMHRGEMNAKVGVTNFPWSELADLANRFCKDMDLSVHGTAHLLLSMEKFTSLAEDCLGEAARVLIDVREIHGFSQIRSEEVAYAGDLSNFSTFGQRPKHLGCRIVAQFYDHRFFRAVSRDGPRSQRSVRLR